MASPTSVPPPPRSSAGPCRRGDTSAASPVRYLVTFARAAAGASRIKTSNDKRRAADEGRVTRRSLLKRIRTAPDSLTHPGRRKQGKSKKRKKREGGPLTERR